MRFWLLALLLWAAAPLQADTAIAHITDDQVTITRQDAALIYTMRTRYWPDGSRITVLNLGPENSIHRTFVRTVLGLTPKQYQQRVERQINAGTAGAYKVVRSESQMLDHLGRVYGAIGYLSADYLLISYTGGLRALRIVD